MGLRRVAIFYSNFKSSWKNLIWPLSSIGVLEHWISSQFKQAIIKHIFLPLRHWLHGSINSKLLEDAKISYSQE